ncbi:MAG: hypothetical protein IRF6MM_04040 [Candidatus Midichloria mitochondrii]
MFFLSKFTKLYKEWKGKKDLKTKLVELYERAIDEVYELKDRLKNLEKANYELGIYHLKNNDISDALLRFNLLELFRCKRPGLAYYMAHCYMDQLKYDRAEKYIKLYTESGDGQFVDEVNYFRSLIEKQEVNQIPITLIADKFDQLADSFDEFHLKGNKVAPQFLTVDDIVKAANSSHGKSLGNNVLDLGCGTGIIGQLLRESKVANAIVGVDISKKMLANSKRKSFDGQKVYAQLLNEDAIKFLRQADSTSKTVYDIIVMADFITFNRNIADIATLLRNITDKKTILAISFKKAEKSDINFVHKRGEFRYSPEFIKNNFSSNGWTLFSEQNVMFSNQNAGVLIIFVKD